jgi:ClpP class serine protease
MNHEVRTMTDEKRMTIKFRIDEKHRKILEKIARERNVAVEEVMIDLLIQAMYPSKEVH